MLNAWTTYNELTEDQKARIGGYVKAKDQARAACLANVRAAARTRSLMVATGGDPMKAFALAMTGGGL